MSREHIWKIVGIFVGFAVLAAIFFIPVPQSRITNPGVDAFQAHRPLFGSQTQGSDVALQGPLLGVGAILVDMYHQQQLQDVLVTASNPSTGTVLGQTTLLAIHNQDDAFVTAPFPTPITANAVRLTFSAPAATAAAPMGIRLDPKSSLPHLASDQLQAGELALLLQEKVPLWRSLATQMVQRLDIVWMILAAIVLSVVLCAVAFFSSRLPWLRINPAGAILITCLAMSLAALVTHQAYVKGLHGVSGGDPYEYLAIAKSISRGENPFLGVKRLPGLPLLLVPAFALPSIDDIAAMRFVAVASGAGILIVLALLARELGLPPSVQLLAPLLLAWQKDFFWTSWRPEPYTLYAFLLMLSLLLFFRLQKPRNQLFFSFVLGYAAMTRQEGFVLAVVLGVAAILYYKRKLQWADYARAFLPAGLLVSPFFIHNAAVYGNPFFTPYLEGDRLQIVNSWEMFKDSLGATWGILSSLWKISWDELSRVDITSSLFITSAATWLGWWILRAFVLEKNRYFSWLNIFFSTLILVSTIALLILRPPLFKEMLLVISAAALFVSFIPFLASTSWRGVIVGSVLVSQLLIALWFHPFAKHYQQSFPLLVLMVATLLAAAPPHKGISWPWSRSLAVTACLVPFVIGTLFIFQKLPAEIDKSNQGTALDHVVYKAVSFARTLPGPYGFDAPYLPARLYFDKTGVFYGEEADDPTQEEAWLAANPIRTMIVTNANRTFRHPSPDWTKVKSFKTEGKDEVLLESTIYTLWNGNKE